MHHATLGKVIHYGEQASIWPEENNPKGIEHNKPAKKMYGKET